MTQPTENVEGRDPPGDSIVTPPSSRSLVSTEDPTRGTEFGGVGGTIQPPPHVPTASERLAMVYAIDPTDPGTEAGSVVPPELEGEFQ